MLVFKRLEPDFGLEGFNTSLRNHDVTISGIKLGVQWQEKYTAGLAWYSLDSKLDEPKPWLGKSVNARLHMSYTCIYTEYSFFENEYWEWAAGLQTGIGTIYNAYTDNTGSERDIGRDYFPLISPYISGDYKLLYWLGIGGGIGMRLSPESGVTSPWIDFGVEIFFKPLYQHLIKPKFKF